MQIHPKDNVEIREDGHKYALSPIKKGAAVIKYGQKIGHATMNIQKGDHVHTHNLATDLSGKLEYTYQPNLSKFEHIPSPTFMGYRREGGKVGIRNEIFIVPTVGCINKTAELLARKTGAKAFCHPFGCSQLGEDHHTTQKILKGIVNHPNAAGVLVLGLGCENNNIEEFKKVLGEWNPKRIRFLNSQDEEDELQKGLEIIKELQQIAEQDQQEKIPLSALTIGLKCGGSDAFSGIYANPLVGRFCERFCAMGGKAVLTEVPEMFGAEHLLMERCADEETFRKTVELINNFKDYYERYGQVIYENPSPGNKAGGITTLEEKSLGCIQKGGLAPIVDVLNYGDRVNKSGLSLLNGPGNDMVAVTNLLAAGCHLILFTTGRGTPLGTGVPTLKIASNNRIFEKKSGWFDFCAEMQNEEDLEALILQTANGCLAKNEEKGYEEISIFKDGVTL